MKEYLEELFRQNGLRISLIFIIAIICINVILVVYYRSIIITSFNTEKTNRKGQRRDQLGG